jgi:hypothetical protein
MKMTFESLDLAKFSTLEKEQMSMVFGGACRTGGGTVAGANLTYSSDTRNDDGSVTTHLTDSKTDDACKADNKLKDC